MRKTGEQPYRLCEPDFRVRLKQELQRRKRKNKAFSLRAFARVLNVDHSTLQKIINGKRPIGAKTIRVFGARLGLGNELIEEFVIAHRDRRKIGTSLSHDKKRVRYEMLTSDVAGLISRWETYAILELSKFPDFAFNAQTVADVLDMEEHAVQVLFDVMVAAGWMSKSVKGGFKARIEQTSTNPADETLNEARQKLMNSILSKSAAAYSTIPRSARLHYAKTIVFDRDLVDEVAGRIRNFVDDLETFIDANVPRSRDVFQIQIGFYPVTNLYSKKL